MKHLVTGGSGFLGNLIARRLLDRGEQVTVLDVWEDPERPKEIAFVPGDIRDTEAVRRAMQGIDVVHHNAALVPLTKSGKQFWEVNVDGSRIAAEQAVKAGVKAFVYMSSSAVFGVPERFPITDQTPLKPVEQYGRAKLAGEQRVKEICEQAKLPLIVIRPRTILGKGRLGIFQILFDWISQNRNVYVSGTGNHRLQFIHANDLMDCYLLALDHQQPGVYNVGTDRFGTLREALGTLITHARSTSRIKSLPAGLTITALRTLDLLGLSPLAPYHYLTYHKGIHFDVSTALGLGWKPKYSNEEMLKETYDWFLANRERLAAEHAGSVHRRPVKQGLLWVLKKFS